MDDIVGIRIVDAQRGEVGLLSWGRIGDSVNPEPLLNRLRKILPNLGFNKLVEVSLCSELGELRDFQLSYEGIVHFAVAYANRKSSDLHDPEHDDEALRKSIYLLGKRRA